MLFELVSNAVAVCLCCKMMLGASACGLNVPKTTNIGEVNTHIVVTATVVPLGGRFLC